MDKITSKKEFYIRCAEMQGEDETKWMFICPCCLQTIDIVRMLEMIDTKEISYELALRMCEMYPILKNIDELEAEVEKIIKKREEEKGTIDIKGIDKAQLLKALYDNSRPLGMGIVHYNPEPMDIKYAEEIVNDFYERNEDLYFDYLQGRIMKVNLSSDTLDTRLYNRDNGQGTAEQIVKELRKRLGYTSEPMDIKEAVEIAKEFSNSGDYSVLHFDSSQEKITKVEIVRELEGE